MKEGVCSVPQAVGISGEKGRENLDSKKEE